MIRSGWKVKRLARWDWDVPSWMISAVIFTVWMTVLLTVALLGPSL